MVVTKVAIVKERLIINISCFFQYLAVASFSPLFQSQTTIECPSSTPTETRLFPSAAGEMQWNENEMKIYHEEVASFSH